MRFSSTPLGFSCALQKPWKAPRLVDLGRRERILLCNLSRRELGVAKILLALFTLALLSSGCAKEAWGPDIDASAVACRSTYGFPPDSPEYDQCIKKLKALHGQ